MSSTMAENIPSEQPTELSRSQQYFASAEAEPEYSSMDVDNPSPPGHRLGDNLDIRSATLEDQAPASYTDSLSINDYLSQTALAATTGLKPIGNQKTAAENAALFNNACQQHRLQHHFEYEEKSHQQFSAKVQFGKHTLQDDNIYPSKKLAKDAISKKALEILRSLPDPSGENQPSASVPADKDLCLEENYIGRLVEFCQKNGLPSLHFQEYEADCRDGIVKGESPSGRLYAVSLSIPDVPDVFGGETSLYVSKQVAKRHAAKEAVLFLRGNGMLESDSNQKHQEASSTTSDEKPTVDNSKEQSAPVDTKNSYSGNSSAAAQVADLALALGISQPQYNYTPCSPPPGATALTPSAFVSVSASFTKQDMIKYPRIQGNVCKVTNVFGRKRAKEDCAKKLLVLLQEVKKSKAK